jgi:hypothetical protein
MNTFDLFNKVEDLDPELEAHFNKSHGFPCIQHPLVYSMMHSPQMNAVVNYQLKHKKEAVEKAKKEKNWNSYVFLHERAYRVNALSGIVQFIKTKQYWELLASVWVDSENIFQNEELWNKLLCVSLPGTMMNKGEAKKLDHMPDEFEIYRGYSISNRWKGLSWTIKKDKALWFATRFKRPNETAKLAYGTIKKEDVIAYLESRQESEIVVFPGKIKNLKKEIIVDAVLKEKENN